MASFAQFPTLAYTAALGLDAASAADLARIAFGVLLWLALVVVNGTAAGDSPGASGLDARDERRPHRRLERSEAARDRFSPPEAA
jgi:hypothetical protein